jgi:hypothetical protein
LIVQAVVQIVLANFPVVAHGTITTIGPKVIDTESAILTGVGVTIVNVRVAVGAVPSELACTQVSADEVRTHSMDTGRIGTFVGVVLAKPAFPADITGTDEFSHPVYTCAVDTRVFDALIDFRFAMCPCESIQAITGVAVDAIHARSTIQTDCKYAFVIIDGAVRPRESRGTLTGVGVVAVDAKTSIFAAAFDAVVRIDFAVGAAESGETQTQVTIGLVLAESAILTQAICAFINIDFAMFSGESRRTRAGVPINLIDARGLVQTNSFRTVVDIVFAVDSIVSR